MIYKSRALDFAFRKPEFNTIYHTYSNESPSKYYISVLGGGGSEAMLIYGWSSIVGNILTYMILEHSLSLFSVGVVTIDNDPLYQL